MKPKTIPFTKMVGTGNDFIVFDNRSNLFRGGQTTFFSEICRRRLSVGGDGVLLLEEGESASIRMRYFNSDGREATMCGNGARCLAFYARVKTVVDVDDFSVEASDGIHCVKVVGNEVTLEMSRPTGFRSGLGILEEPEFVEGGFVNTGVSHFVIFVPDTERVDVEAVGKFYRSHGAFPDGANVNFVQRLEGNRIRVRTYEKGVEKETLSCGTGCVASAYVAQTQCGDGSPVRVLTRGGELAVGFDPSWDRVTLTGRVEIVYEGVLTLSS